jgi:hypothetical protein
MDGPWNGPNVGEGAMLKTAMMPSMRQRMDQAVQEAQKRLDDVKRAKELFDKNPELEELLNIMQRTHF